MQIACCLLRTVKRTSNLLDDTQSAFKRYIIEFWRWEVPDEKESMRTRRGSSDRSTIFVQRESSMNKLTHKATKNWLRKSLMAYSVQRAVMIASEGRKGKIDRLKITNPDV